MSKLRLGVVMVAAALVTLTMVAGGVGSSLSVSGTSPALNGPSAAVEPAIKHSPHSSVPGVLSMAVSQNSQKLCVVLPGSGRLQPQSRSSELPVAVS